MPPALATLADLPGFDEIIDVRSPAEFAEDHIPGAANCPVLDDAQRAEVGTLYKQVSPFEAKKLGAALISANIARHLHERFRERPREWKPLIYCWRGGDRSGAMTTVFRSIGWRAGQLGGGYRTWRSHVIAALAELPGRFAFRVVCGPTGSAKTRVLQSIAAHGGQVLDLETLAAHKGSVLGVLPDQAQPGQKWFETQLLQALAALDPARPVFVEAESRKIGRIHLPEALIGRIRAGDCIAVDATLESRVEFLLRDYAYFLDRPQWLSERLDLLKGLQSRETLERWQGLVAARAWMELVRELLEAHYDPLYRRSQEHNFTGIARPSVFATDDLSTAGIDALAVRILAQSRTAQIA